MYLTYRNSELQFEFYFKVKSNHERWNPNQDNNYSLAMMMDQIFKYYMQKLTKFLPLKISISYLSQMTKPHQNLPEVPGEQESKGSMQPTSGNKSHTVIHQLMWHHGPVLHLMSDLLLLWEPLHIQTWNLLQIVARVMFYMFDLINKFIHGLKWGNLLETSHDTVNLDQSEIYIKLGMRLAWCICKTSWFYEVQVRFDVSWEFQETGACIPHAIREKMWASRHT